MNHSFSPKERLTLADKLVHKVQDLYDRLESKNTIIDIQRKVIVRLRHKERNSYRGKRVHRRRKVRNGMQVS